MRLLVIAVLGLGSTLRPLAAQIVEERRPFKATRAADGRETVAEKNSLKESDRACDLGGSRIADRAFVDLLNGGQLQTSAELVRICVGEGKIVLPLYFLMGSNSASVSDPSDEQKSLATLIAPTAGTFNVQLVNANELKSWGKFTDLSVSYQAGIRYSRLPVAGSADVSEPVVSGDFAAGLRFQTVAWKAGDPATSGLFWVQAQLGGRVVSQANMQRVFGLDARKPTTVSVEGGIMIEGLITLKWSWSKVLNNDQTPGLKRDVLKLGVDLKTHKQAPSSQ